MKQLTIRKVSRELDRAIAIREGAMVTTYDTHFKHIHRVGTHLLEACRNTLRFLN